MKDILQTCNKLIRFSTTEEIDFHAEKQLKTSLYEYRSVKKVPLAAVRFVVNGEKVKSLLDAMVEFEELKTLEVQFFKPRLKENWDYNQPTKSLILIGQGLGGVQTFGYDAFKLKKWDTSQSINREKVMIRCFISKFYFPRSIKTKSANIHDGHVRPYVPELMTLERLWEEIRQTGVVPFQLHISAYKPTSRYNYELDLVNNTLLKDFRGGTMPLRDRKVRGSIEHFNFDMILATTEMKDLVKRVFITLFDVKELTAADIALSFGVTDTMAKNSLDAIVSRGLAEKEGHPPREIYSITAESLAEKEGDDEYDDY